MKRGIRMLAFVAATLVAALAFADPKLDQLATRLAELRAEVEGLSSRVEESKQTRRADQRSFASQRADLEFQLQREQRRVAQLEAQMEKRKARIAQASVGGKELVPAVKSSLAELRARIETGLPFKRGERLAQLDELERKLDEGVLTPQKATVQLWALVEDELRLTRENGMYRQIVELDGDEVLVDVARLGMVTMYFQSDDGRVGWVEKHGDDWRWKPTTTETEQQQILLLFDALSKQIRTGYFELPALPGGTR